MFYRRLLPPLHTSISLLSHSLAFLYFHTLPLSTLSLTTSFTAPCFPHPDYPSSQGAASSSFPLSNPIPSIFLCFIPFLLQAPHPPPNLLYFGFPITLSLWFVIFLSPKALCFFLWNYNSHYKYLPSKILYLLHTWLYNLVKDQINLMPHMYMQEEHIAERLHSSVTLSLNFI